MFIDLKTDPQLNGSREIRYELEIPGSVLEHIESQLGFPSPPKSSDTQLEPSAVETTTTWYYYLADIAARHHINRIINVGSKLSGPPSEAQAWALLRDYEIFSTHLDDWHQSLPRDISFEPPNLRLTPEPNWFKNILRARYLFIREILCRPFLRICLNYVLDLPDQLITEIARIASIGLQYCAWSLQSFSKPTRLDHGIWTGIRHFTASAMILMGAAQRYRFPSLNGASRLCLPNGWHDSVRGFLDTLELFSEENRGGLRHCHRLISWGLREFQSTATQPSR